MIFFLRSEHFEPSPLLFYILYESTIESLNVQSKKLVSTCILTYCILVNYTKEQKVLISNKEDKLKKKSKKEQKELANKKEATIFAPANGENVSRKN